MKPSAVRARILREHEEIRGLLDRLEQAVRALRDGDRGGLDEARTVRDALCARLFEHIDLEDAILAPALRDADAWGEERAGELLRHHREQRGELTALGRMDEIDPTVLGARLERFVADVRADMRHEETALLDPDLLRDDVIGIGVSGG